MVRSPSPLCCGAASLFFDLLRRRRATGPAQTPIEMLRTVIRFSYDGNAFSFNARHDPDPMVPPDLPSLRQLRAFEAAARLESVSGAAREVNLSQPALTQSLHALEARLSARLFERRRSGCYVTEPGAILLPRVRRFFDHIRSAIGEPAVGAPFAGRRSVEAIINKADQAAAAQPDCDFRESVVRSRGALARDRAALAAPLRERA